jgi:hypothetical protein
MTVFLPFLACVAPLQVGAADMSKARAWALGERLSQAAIAYAGGADPTTVNGTLSDAEAIARDLGVEVRPFPPKSADPAAQMLSYLIKGDGWALARQLADKYDSLHAVFYEIAVKANLLLLIKQDDVAKTLTAVIADRSRDQHLPAYIWQGVVDLGQRQAHREPLTRALRKMHDDAIAFLSDSTSNTTSEDTTRFSAMDVRIELPKTTYTLGDSFSFVVTTNRDCYFLVFTIDANDKVELHDPVVSGPYMGHPLLKAGERRQIPVPDAPGRAVITPPAGSYEIGAVCGREELNKFGFTQVQLNEPARAGRRSFQFHLEETAKRVDRNALSRTTVGYEVRP